MSTHKAKTAGHHGGHDDMAGHDHKAHMGHAHAGHHVMVHAPAAGVAEAYRKAYGPADRSTRRRRARGAPNESPVGAHHVALARDPAACAQERVLVLSDATVEPTGELSPDNDRQGWDGNVRLVNGVAEPEVMVAGGQVERWRVINASSARYVKLSIDGRAFVTLGTGGGLLESPLTVHDALLPPGDRIDIEVGPFEPGETVSVLSAPYDRGFGGGESERFATVRVAPRADSQAVFPQRLRVIEPLVTGPLTPTREVRLGERAGGHGEVDYLINETQHLRGEDVVVGELQVWDIVNTSALDHPFHLHGFFFQVVERDGVAPAFRSWEDTVNVPAGGRVRIAWMPDDRPGEWMYHCHILEHHAAGMTAHFRVVRGASDHEPSQVSPHVQVHNEVAR